MFRLFCDLLRIKNKDMLPGWRSWRHIPSSTDIRNRSQTVLVGWWKKHRTLFLQESNSWLHRNVRYKLIKDFPFPKPRRICKCFSRCLLLPQDDDESKIARLSNFGWCHNQSKRSYRECVVYSKKNSKYKMSNFSKSPSRNSWWILVIVQFWQLSYDCNKSKRGCMRKVTKVTLGCEHPLWNPCNGRNFCTRYHFSSTSMHIPGPKSILSLKVCSSWGMMGMSTDQIAEVFTMDSAEVVKILERAERSTSKDRVDMGNKMSFWPTMSLGHENQNILWEIEVLPSCWPYTHAKFDMFPRCLGLRHLDQAIHEMWNFSCTAERTWSAINLEAVHRASVCWSLCLHLIEICHSEFPGIIVASFCHFAGAVACETNSDNLVATFHHPRSRGNANPESRGSSRSCTT